MSTSGAAVGALIRHVSFSQAVKVAHVGRRGILHPFWRCDFCGCEGSYLCCGCSSVSALLPGSAGSLPQGGSFNNVTELARISQGVVYDVSNEDLLSAAQLALEGARQRRAVAALVSPLAAAVATADATVAAFRRGLSCPAAAAAESQSQSAAAVAAFAAGRRGCRRFDKQNDLTSAGNQWLEGARSPAAVQLECHLTVAEVVGDPVQLGTAGPVDRMSGNGLPPCGGPAMALVLVSSAVVQSLWPAVPRSKGATTSRHRALHLLLPILMLPSIASGARSLIVLILSRPLPLLPRTCLACRRGC